MEGHSFPLASRLRAFAVFQFAGMVACLALAAPAAADSVWIQSGSANPIALSNVKVVGVQDGALTFTTSSGRQDTRPLKQVPEITLDDEPAFSAAEQAFAAHDFTAAADNYHKALDTTAKEWVKERSSLRLLESANQSGNFPAAVAGFLDLLTRNAAVASQNKPAIPKSRPDLLDPVIAEVKRAAGDGKLAADQKQLLLGYLADLYSAKGDVNGANAAIAKMGKAAPADAANAESRSLAADAKLTQARQAFGQKQYPRTAQILESSGGLFTDPAQQADALYLLAQATASQANPKDSNQQKDAALAYMRVVANCKTMEGRPHVAESLMRVAAIEEDLKNTKDALALYNQVASEFKGSSAAAQARREAARIGPIDKSMQPN